MAFLTTLLLAIFVVPAPWGIPLVAAGVVIEAAEAWLALRWSRRRRAGVGAEAMVGTRAVVIEDGWVRIAGERWRARSTAPLDRGSAVVVTAVDGLTLVVRRAE